MRTVGALCGAVLLWLTAAPIAAAHDVTYTPKGAVEIVWTGDPARGCATAGVCSVVGSLQVEAGTSGSYSTGTGTPIEITDPNAVARVEYPSDDGGGPRVCVEPEPFDVSFKPGLPLRAKAQTLAPERSFAISPPSAGDCAGPTVAQLLKLRLTARPRGGHRYDLSGTDHFGAGPFEVSISSNLQISVTPSKGSSGTGSAGRQPKPQPELEEYAQVDYRVVGFGGRVTIPFAGAPAPGCEPMAACDASGALSMATGAPRQTFRVEGEQIVRYRISPSRALADLVSGRLPADDNFEPVALHDSLSATFAAPGLARCTDTLTTSPGDITSIFTDRSDVLTFLPGPGPNSELIDDPLRTDCPGPGSYDAIYNTSLATGTVPIAQLRARRVNAVLHASGAFVSTAYTGTRRGSIRFTLIRTREWGGTRRIRAIPGELP